MEVITIDKLPEVEELANNDLFPINQEAVTKCVQVGKINDFIQENTMGIVNILIEEQAAARIQGDSDALAAAKEYTDQEIINNKLAVNEWLAPVKTVSQIPKTGLDKTRNYLIKVTADPAKSGVYQAVAGWATVPNWILYDDAVDLVDEQELKAAVDGHNKNNAAHEDIRAAMQKINEDYVNGGDIENAVNAHNQNITSHADIRNIIANHTGVPSWDGDNFILTFAAENGAALKVDIPLESLSKDLAYDPLAKELIIIKQDGAEIRVSVADLVDVYEGFSGEHVKITVEDNLIRAVLLSGSVTENELSNALLEKIDGKIDEGMIGEPNGVASLDAQAKIPLDQLPDVAVGDISGLVGEVGKKQDELNRTVTGDDNASGSVTDTGGDLSIPIPVTVAAGTAAASLPGTGKMSLREWLTAIRRNAAYLISAAAYNAQIVTLYQDNQQAELASLYGGTWLRVTSPAPRALTAVGGPSCSSGSSQFSGSTSANVPHSGAVKGSVVSIWVCANPGNWTGTLRSSTRGVLQSIKAGSDGRVIFNSVTLQDGEQLSVECPPPFTGYASWTAVNGNVSRTEYIYFRG